MSQSIEASGPDIESAVADAVAQLGVTPDRVQVEILEEPIRRLLGLGVRPARVRVTVIGAVDAPAPAPMLPTAAPKPAAEPKPTPAVEPELAVEASAIAPPEAKPPIVKPPRAKAEPRSPKTAKPDRAEGVPNAEEAVPAVHEPEPDDEDSEVAEVALTQLSDEQLDQDAQMAAEVLRKLMGFMSIEGSVTVRHADTDGREARHWLLEVQGSDLASLIGNKGETLAALQYLTRLLVSRQIGHHANLIIDVAGYKSHREEMLKRLAKRMAGQAVELKRTVTLEPMPPHERRIVHLTLRDHPAVTTESVGEGDKRKVTIIPRRKS